MLALSYDCALRREELCAIDTRDIDPSSRLIRIPAENTKNRRERVVPFSEGSAQLFAAYLKERSGLVRERGALFLSRSRRNTGRPLSILTWSKVVEGIADRSGVLEFTTHTARHLRPDRLGARNLGSTRDRNLRRAQERADNAAVYPPEWPRTGCAVSGRNGPDSRLAVGSTRERRVVKRLLRSAVVPVDAQPQNRWQWPIDATTYDRFKKLRRPEIRQLAYVAGRQRPYGHFPTPWRKPTPSTSFIAI